MDDDRLAELERLVRRPDAYGFRSECMELIRELRRLRRDNEIMRSLRVRGDYGVELVADTLDWAAKQCDSSLHEVAGRMLREMRKSAADAMDRVADRDNVVAVLRRCVANLDVQCSLDHHGYCQEHNYATPCPIPEAHRLTASGTEYVPKCGKWENI